MRIPPPHTSNNNGNKPAEKPVTAIAKRPEFGIASGWEVADALVEVEGFAGGHFFASADGWK